MKQQFGTKQDLLVNDFKEQCNQVRDELSKAYKDKLAKKLNKFKQEYSSQLKAECDSLVE